MPQDSLRSAVYRSFVTCDDPKGVVDCGTIRKSKSNPNRSEDKSTSGRMPKNLNSSSSSYMEKGKEMVPEKATEEFPNPSSFQLMEVSRGAQKLNQVIDSWSKGMNFDGNPKEIAKDLLKGALDLQESLIVLGKLQEASQYMAKLKKKQKEKSRGERIDQVGIERTKSLHFPDHNYVMGFQKPRLSADGSLRDYFEQKEKSRGERIHEVGIERTSSHHFADHNSRDYLEQKERSRGERIREVGIERTSSHRFTDHNSQMGFQNLRLSADGYSRDLFEQKERSRRESIHEVGIERTSPHRFMDHTYQMGFQKSRLSANGSSRDCFDELRTAIRDGLAKQNLLPPSCAERKAFCDNRYLESTMDIASTSSSQSSTVNFRDSASYDSSLSSKAPNKSKGSSLVAKLMGLEEIPSQAVQTAPRKQLESHMSSSPRRAVFDIDMPKARKPQSAEHKADTELVKLKDIVETMQFKGLLKCNSAEGLGLQSHDSITSNSNKRSTEDAPPIVIMRPWRFSSTEAKEPRLPKFMRDESLDTDVFRKTKTKTKEIRFQTVDHGEGAKHANEMGKIVEEDETPIKRLSREGDTRSKEVEAKPEEIAVKTNDKLSSSKLKASEPVNQQQRKKAVEKKVDRIKKVTPSRKKPAEVENVKSKAVTKSKDEAKVTSPKERKPEAATGSTVTKSRIFQQKSTSSSITPKHPTPVISHGSGDRKKNQNTEKPDKEPLAADLVVENENVECKCGDKLIDVICENEADIPRTSTTTADQVLTKEGINVSEIQIEEQCDSNQNSVINVAPQTTQHEIDAKSAEEAKYCIGQDTTEKKCFITENNAKDFFLSSPSFLSYAEELFDINSTQAIVFQTTSLNDPGTQDTRLLLDCANELMKHKHHRCTQTLHPLFLTPSRSTKTSISLSQLVEEICDGIQHLRSYSKHAGEKIIRTESLFAFLERDLRCQGVVTGGWDLGWKHSFSAEDVEQVVSDIEKLVFIGLMEDMFADFKL